MSENDIVLEVRDITKTFPGVKALDGVSFQIRRGEVHALLGANGAGKSTLIKIIAGMYGRDSGEILMDGQPVQIRNPIDAQNLGISVVFQELTVFPDLNVLENIFMNREITRGALYDWKAMKRKTQQIIDDVTASNQRISASTGVTPTLIRCPYGEYDDHVIAAIRSMGMEPIQWDVEQTETT